MLYNPIPVPEKVSIYGPTGVGKSTCYLSIARALNYYGSPAPFHVLSTDNGLGRILHVGYRDLIAAGLVNLLPCYTWADMEAHLDRLLPYARPDHWIVLDLACLAWEMAQDYYTEKVYNKGLEELFMDHRAAFEKSRSAKKSNGPPLDGMRDWPTIKKVFSTFTDKLLKRAPCNVFLCSTSKPINSAFDEAEIQQEYGRIGARPAGNKILPFLCETNLYLSKRTDANGEWRWLRTHKDRERRVLDEPFQDFAMYYLCGVAGWQVA